MQQKAGKLDVRMRCTNIVQLYWCVRKFFYHFVCTWTLVCFLRSMQLHWCHLCRFHSNDLSPFLQSAYGRRISGHTPDFTTASTAVTLNISPRSRSPSPTRPRPTSAHTRSVTGPDTPSTSRPTSAHSLSLSRPLTPVASPSRPSSAHTISVPSPSIPSSPAYSPLSSLQAPSATSLSLGTLHTLTRPTSAQSTRPLSATQSTIPSPSSPSAVSRPLSAVKSPRPLSAAQQHAQPQQQSPTRASTVLANPVTTTEKIVERITR